jgi:Legionella pneumophila major outer membrane protein precursor
MRKILFAMAVFGSCTARFCDFYGGVEALYWKPAHCPIPYVRAENTDGSLDPHAAPSITGDYDWGFRVHVGGTRECRFTDVAYHWLETNDTAGAEKGSFTNFRLPGRSDGSDVLAARAKLHSRYQGIDWRVGYSMALCGAELRFYGDIRWTDLDLFMRTAGPEGDVPGNPIAFLELHSRYSAGGIGAGIEGVFPLWCDLSFGTRVTVTGLVGDASLKRFVAHSNDGEIESDFYIPTSRTTVNPLLDVRFELSYDRCVCGRMWKAKLGYEIDYILNPLVYWTTTEDDQPGSGGEFPITGCNDFGYAGIYFGISASF